MEAVNSFFASANEYLWGIPMIVLLLGTHIYLTVRTRFIQRYIPLAIRLSLATNHEGEGDVSQFGALTTSLAATIGTGNIVGVATAVALGGPGAILWTWLTGVFGIATKYAEGLLAVKYRVKMEDGTMLGGPMYALERGLGLRWLAVLFCVFTAVAAFGIGNFVQASAISDNVHALASSYTSSENADVVRIVAGVVLTLLTASVILGGIRSISHVCERLVPFMAVFYVASCLVILMMNIGAVPEAIAKIISEAFSGKAAAGGFAGSAIIIAMRAGVSRGLFSNESGLGSAPIVAAAAQTKNPVRQALVSSSGTFWDTVVVCAITGIVLVATGAYQTGTDGQAMTQTAFAHIPSVGPVLLTISLSIFVFSTILGWSYYGEKAVEYLLGIKSILPYRYLWVAAVLAGSLWLRNMAWDFADSANALMAVPNLVSLLLLSPVIVHETKKYLWDSHIEDAGDGD